MNRSNLATQLAKETKMSKKEAEKFIATFGNVVCDALKKHQKVIYSNFGTFYTINYPSKIINYPGHSGGNKKQIVMSPTDVIKWMPSDNLKDRVDHSLETDTITSYGSGKKVKQKKRDAGIPEHKAKVVEEEEVNIPVRVIKKQSETEEKHIEINSDEEKNIKISVKNSDQNQTENADGKPEKQPEPEEINEPIEIAKSAPAKRIIDLILKRALRDGASAVMIDPEEKGAYIRFKINGKVFNKTEVNSTIYKAILARMRSLTGNQTNSKLPLQGKFKTTILGQEENFELLSLPTIHGDKILINVEDRLKTLHKLTELELFEESYRDIKKILEKKGLILVASKSKKDRLDLLYSLADELSDANLSIISVENNPLLVVPKFNQVKINTEQGFTYDKSLNFIEKFRPEVVLIDELTTPELIERALFLSADKIVLAGISAEDSLSTLKLFANLGIEKKALASYLGAIIATKTVAKLCRSCHRIVKLENRILRQVRDILIVLPTETRARLRKIGKNFYDSPGCHFCNNTGYDDEIGLYEIFELNDKIRKMLDDNVDIAKIEKEAIRAGFINLKQDGITKALLGEISVLDVLE